MALPRAPYNWTQLLMGFWLKTSHQGNTHQLNHQIQYVSLPSSSLDFHPDPFNSISPKVIRSTVLKMDGSPGPSGLDVAAWKHLCTSFWSASHTLCSALSSLAKHLCTMYVDPAGLYPLLASRLSVLDKNCGAHPIGIDEVVHRLQGKTILNVIGPEVLEVASSSHLCASRLSWREAGVHATRELFSLCDWEAVLLVDASNGFNSINCQNLLWNILNLCPALVTIVINCSCVNVPLFIEGDVIFSTKCTTQGDLLAMVFYAVGIIPLMQSFWWKRLSSDLVCWWWCCSWNFFNICDWWTEICSFGPGYGWLILP